MLLFNNCHYKIKNMLTVLILAALFTLLLSGCGAEQPKVYRVGILGGGSMAVISDGFKAGMAELGYIEGQNIVYDAPATAADLSDVQGIAQKFVEDKVDLIFTSGSTPSALAAKAATEGTDIPVVFSYAATEESNLVESVREPGGNITGVRYPGPEQISRRLEILLELAPQVKRVWIGYDKNNPNTDLTLKALRPAASALGVTLVEVPAATIEEIEADLAARAQAADPGLDAIILMPDGFSHGPDGFALMTKFAAEHKIPLCGSFLYTVEQGAVFGNANDLIKVGELAAPLADKIFKGTPAGTIPVITPEQDLYINYKVAQELGLTVPEGLLKQAAQIIR
ncbi:MAG: ABC transporter substrate-binding protein [Anaerolineae bacterium]|nr:ABC transporter substrate-binding protein [Anaerolineae bacterium]